jgi:anthranilate phosphoribosyltransferase
MKEILNFLFQHQSLSRSVAKQILLDIGKGVYNDHELSAFITVYLMRTITLEELIGFREALLEMCVKIDFEERKVMDIVGTGGDGKNTFNISTLSCFIVAGAGQPVAKHGSYGASSVSGASNLMETLGYKFKSDADQLKRELDETNMCFLHAPVFHPALKTVAPIRRNLGVRTFFNLLGPMVNPSNPSFQLVGVYNLEVSRFYNYLLQLENRKYAIVHSMDGYDEVSLTSDVKLITAEGESMLSPVQLCGHYITQTEIYGGDSVHTSAELFMRILKGEGTLAQQNVVLANSALALLLTDSYSDYSSAFDAAKESLKSGKALNVLNKLISLQVK